MKYLLQKEGEFISKKDVIDFLESSLDDDIGYLVNRVPRIHFGEKCGEEIIITYFNWLKKDKKGATNDRS